VSKPVAVIVGACSESGLHAARGLGRDHHLVLSDSNGERLVRTLEQVDAMGFSAESIVADVTDRRSCEILMVTARTAGPIATVTQPVSHSPRANTIGLLNVSRAVLAVATKETTLIQSAISSPRLRGARAVSQRVLKLADTDPEAFMKWVGRVASLLPSRFGVADVCAQFAIWHHTSVAAQFNARGATLITTFADRVLTSAAVDSATGELSDFLTGLATQSGTGFEDGWDLRIA